MRLSVLCESSAIPGPFPSQPGEKFHCVVCSETIETSRIKGKYGANFHLTNKMEIPDKYQIDGYVVSGLTAGEPVVQMSRSWDDKYTQVKVCSELCAEAVMMYDKVAHDMNVGMLVKTSKPRIGWFDHIIAFYLLETPQQAAELKGGLSKLGYITSPVVVGFNIKRTAYCYGVCVMPVEGIKYRSMHLWDYEPGKYDNNAVM